MSLKVTGIGWIGIRSLNLDKQTTFYRDVLELPMHQRTERFAHFQLPWGTLLSTVLEYEQYRWIYFEDPEGNQIELTQTVRP